MRNRLLGLTGVALRRVIIAQQPNLDHQSRHKFGIKLFPTTTTKRSGKHNVAKTRPNQTANCQTNGFKHTTNFAISTFIQSYAIPPVTALATNEFDHAKTSRTIIEGHTVQQ
jgi:hypothetical protein